MCVWVCVCALHYFYFTFGAGYLLGLQLHVLYIFIKLAPLWLHVDNPFGLFHISLALRVTRSLHPPSYPLLSSVSVLFSMPRALFGLLHVLSPSRVGGCRAKAKFTGVGHKCH